MKHIWLLSALSVHTLLALFVLACKCQDLLVRCASHVLESDGAGGAWEEHSGAVDLKSTAVKCDQELD